MLNRKQLVITPPLRHTFFMRATFNDLPVFDVQNAVDMDDRRQTMGDDQRRTVFRQTLNRFLSMLLMLSIKGGRRLIKNQNRQAFQKHEGGPSAAFGRQTA